MWVNAFVSALRHSYPIISAPYPIYDCAIDSMEHPMVTLRHLSACRQCCEQCCGLVCVLAGCRRKREGATGADPLHPSDQRQAKQYVFCSCSLVLVGRLVQKLATDHLISIARMAFPFFSHSGSETGPGLWRETLFCLCKGNFSASLADRWVSDRAKMTKYKDSTERRVLTRNCRDHL